MLKETSLAKHCLLVLRIHANFSHLFRSAHQHQECLLQKYLMLAGTMHSLLFFPTRVLHIHVWKGCQKLPLSQQS